MNHSRKRHEAHDVELSDRKRLCEKHGLMFVSFVSVPGRTKTVVVSRERVLNVGKLENRWVLPIQLYDSRERPFAMRMDDWPRSCLKPSFDVQQI
jgi:hypothetical protein